MLISKFDLYKPEWLELVFEDRNKSYGAYDLRQHYARNMVMAMGITFLAVGLLFGAGVMLRPKQIAIVQIPPNPTTVVTITHIDPPPPITHRKPIIEPPKPAGPIKTTADLPMVVGPDKDAKTPLDPTKITGAIGPVTTPGKIIDPGPLEPASSGTGTAAPKPPDNTVHPARDLEEMPAPIGGENAWAKFLNKNLRFPVPAQDEGVSGMVIVSFIIEKNGSLSNITVERPAGHGFDEEAVRVLKLAKAWKPGIQNGQPVRVKFAIPISFTLSQDNN